LVDHLDRAGIDTRQIFAGNLLRQPAYRDVRHRVASSLDTTDLVAANAFWLGCYPGLGEAHLEYTVEELHRFRSTLRAAA
jgi:CDP-6-deoxy-D-xylo-4-hexulose-3-dehydrase